MHVPPLKSAIIENQIFPILIEPGPIYKGAYNDNQT
jgi:hypothetical protein